jgi:hypothetical protein
LLLLVIVLEYPSSIKGGVQETAQYGLVFEYLLYLLPFHSLFTEALISIWYNTRKKKQYGESIDNPPTEDGGDDVTKDYPPKRRRRSERKWSNMSIPPHLQPSTLSKAPKRKHLVFVSSSTAD